ncbi:karyopherin Kap95 [Cryomyces antarcticus]|nr:karyopherin Kap95 [Cryomyces antarcticus]
MEGPEEKVLDPLIKQALPVLIGMMDDQVVQASQDVNGMHFRSISKPASPTFCRNDADNQLRTAAYEVLNAFVTNAANDSLGVVATLSDVILQRLENTIPMQQQVVSVEDRLTLEEMQTSLTSVVMAIVQRLEAEIKPQGDRIMHILLQLLSTLGAKSSVPDTVFAAVSALASALEDDFLKYMEPFVPYLYNALGNQEEPALCAMAIGLVSDITRALNEKVRPFCDSFMNYLLNNLRVRCSLECQCITLFETLTVPRAQHWATSSNLPFSNASAT